MNVSLKLIGKYLIFGASFVGSLSAITDVEIL